jgi:hypothetical protein
MNDTNRQGALPFPRFLTANQSLAKPPSVAFLAVYASVPRAPCFWQKNGLFSPHPESLSQVAL